ncbi:dipeptidase PepV [Bacillus sp. DJP31]|uniref:dipeptidase PepV n=1 Tax=Bacillus sp. DJP31 TaxID=3409789 RepID=UPI003BB51627
MKQINWIEEVMKRKDDLLSDTQSFLQIESVLDENTKDTHAPFGKGIQEALEFLLEQGSRDGFTVKNVDGYAGHIEYGVGSELVGVLCHIDVVPAGDGWTSTPFSAEIRDGKIFARGALDDKGPTMAAYYAMKIVRDLGLKTNKRLRMIIGTDEESNWGCVEHYFKHEEMPGMGFAPDADFPIIYAEKGICDVTLKQEISAEESDTEYRLLSFSSGRRFNMVPDLAEANIEGSVSRMTSLFEDFLSKNKLTGSFSIEGNTVWLKVNGISAHGMEPRNGVNAGTKLVEFLQGFEFDNNAVKFLKFASTYLVEDSRGESLEIANSDDITGDLTMNVGILAYQVENGGTFGLNIRYPVTHQIETSIDMIKTKSNEFGFTIGTISDSKPHHVDKEHDLVKTLQRVYTEQTGEEATLLSIGGGTYARSLKAGVAFGPLFPGRPDIAHQKDEYIEIDDLVKATAIYAQAIYELIK